MFRTTFRVLVYAIVGFVTGYLVDRLIINRDNEEGAIEGIELPAWRPEPAKPVEMPAATAQKPSIKAKNKEKKPAGAPPEPDDLTRIKGIGPTYAARLQAAGISTFQQLSKTSPDRLREITKIRDWQQPGVAEWLVEAGEIISG